MFAPSPFRIAAALLAFLLSACEAEQAQVSADEPVGEERAAAKADSPGGGRVFRPGDPGVVDVIFEVRADGPRRPISPLVYGVAGGGPDPERQRWGLLRSGGNRLTAYNWENNASNAGADWHFQNDALMGKSDEPAKPFLELLEKASRISAHAVVTLSNADYVAADKKGDGDVRKSGPDYLSTRFVRNYPKKDGPFEAPPDTSDGAVYQDELVAYLKAKYPDADVLFAMDNEPELWSHTHAEIFEEPVTYADLWRRNLTFAKAAKQVWPSAEVLGFVSYGYTGYVSLQDAPDANGRNFVEWYLDQARAAEKREGMRVIDYLDLHWYPEARGGGERIVSQNVAPEVVEARVQAPRSLWDDDYEESSWIRDERGGPIDLLHWLQAKIDRHYPGTKLAFSEWSYGAGNHISGAIAVADVLGVFGRHGVGLASYWPMQPKQDFAFAAFRVFRNYDGKGSAFGDQSIEASSSEVEMATVHASVDGDDPSRVVIVALNKDARARTAGVKLHHSTLYRGARTFVLTGEKPRLVAGPALEPVATNAFRFELPAHAVVVVEPHTKH